MKKRLTQYIYMFVGVVMLHACSLDVPYENQFSDPDAITTPQMARELLATAYSQLPHPEFQLSVLGDDFAPTSWIKRNPDLDNLYKWEPQPIIDLSMSLWQDYYAVIVTLNTLLERLPSVQGAPGEVAQIEAEAKALKAWCYFDLLRLFASDYKDGKDKPGILLKDKVELEFLSRTDVEGCVTAIRTLLTEAVSAMPPGTAEVYWLSRPACLYLLAQVELYAGNYGDAVSYAGQVRDDLQVMETLTPSAYADLWSGNASAERIFAFYSPNIASSFYIDIVYDTNSGDYLALNDALAASYEAGDIRGEYTVYPFRTTTRKMDYFGKYNRMRKEKQEIAYINKLRTAGVCLLLAEAYCLDGEHEAQAVAIMNEYLQKRGAAPLAENLRGNALLRKVLTEKWKEFAGEGQRFFDLKHYRRTLLSTWAVNIGKNISADDYRWNFPIPKEEYLYNDYVEQNDGWNKQLK